MAEIKKTLTSNGNKINYYIRYGNQKNIILRVREGTIYVSAPYNSPDWEVEKLIYKNLSKIIKVQTNYEVRSKHDFYGTQPWIKLFDNTVNVTLIDQNVHAKQTSDGIMMKDYHDLELQLTKLYAFLANHYKNWFINRSSQWAIKMNVQFKNLSVRIMNLKWGVCYPVQQKIIFNTKLLHFRPEIIDYVIVHELAHLRHHNHSKDFWRFVEQYLPNYRELQSELNGAGL
ncbi:M48 family metallopeptidase [Mesoplasma seiffertii]|uniref:M48 family metallopeptidase n=1 Tax=Mesoplasma seiffertii TaxID=28224 RepID=UPI00047B5852|nr:SprT family zinc-dependent metalloprotease [Mesoplasma seiffertii]